MANGACGDCRHYEAGDATHGVCWKMTIRRHGVTVPALAFASEDGECDGFETTRLTSEERTDLAHVGTVVQFPERDRRSPTDFRPAADQVAVA